MQTSVQISAFDSELFGAKILCQGPFPIQKYPNVFEYVKNLREPFAKSILIRRPNNTQTSFHKYNIIIYPEDMRDWSIVATYIAHSLRPILIVAEDIQMPEILYNKIQKQKDITFIHFFNEPLNNDILMQYYDTIIFGNPDNDNVYSWLKLNYNKNYTKQEHNELAKELECEKAGLIWSKYKEKSGDSFIYWYEPLRDGKYQYFTKEQMSEIFRVLSLQFKTT